MKLAEALVLRSDYQSKIIELQNRVVANLRYQEGEEPMENPKELLAEITAVNEKNNALIKRINHANATATYEDGVVLADVLVDRETLKKQRDILSQIVREASDQNMLRYTRMEIKVFLAVDFKELQQQLDTANAALRTVENKIQRKNWQVV